MEGTATTADSNANATGRVSLEDMSRDDLLRQVKRQRILMQKMKNKCDELTGKCSALEREKRESSTSETQISELKAQIDVLISEKEQAIAAYSNIQAAQEEQLQQFEEYEQQLGVAVCEKQQLEQAMKESDKKCKILQKECQSSGEQLECMRLKLDTLTSTCQYLQEDLKKAQLINKEMEGNLRVMEEARDEALQSLKGWKERANENLREMEKLKGEVQILRIERNELLEKFNKNLDTKESLVEKVQELQEEKEKFLKIISEGQEEITILKSELESKTVQISNDRLTDAQQIESIKNENNSLKNENGALIIKIEQLSLESEQKAEVLRSEVNVKNEELTEELKWIKEKYNRLENELSICIKEKHDAIEEIIQVKDLQRFVEDEAMELREENEKLKTEIKTLEADLENDKMHIRKLEKEIHSTEERERNCNIEYEKIKLKLCQLEKANKELRDNVITDKIEELNEKCKSLQTEKDALVVQVENLTQEINVMNQHMLMQNSISCREQVSQTELFFTVDKETSMDNEHFNEGAKLLGVCSDEYVEANESKESVHKERRIVDENALFQKEQSLESSITSCYPYFPEEHPNKEKITKDEVNAKLIPIDRIIIDTATQTVNVNDIFDADKEYKIIKASKSTSCDQIDTEEKAIQSKMEDSVQEIMAELEETRNRMSLLNQEKCDYQKLLRDNQALDKEYKDAMEKITALTHMLEDKSEIAKKMQELAAELEVTRNNMSLLNQEKCCLMDDHNKLLSSSRILDKDYQDATEKVVALTQTLQVKTEIAEKIHCQMDSLLSQIDELNSQLQEKENDLVSAGQKLENKTHEIIALRQTYEFFNAEYELCKKELENLRSGEYHLAKECPLAEKCNTLLEKNNNFEQMCEMLQASNNELKERLEVALKTTEKADEVFALKHEIESFQLLCREQENEINHLHQINKDLNRDLVNAAQEINILNDFKKQFEQNKMQNINLQEEKDKLENKISLLASKLEHSENETILKLQEDINRSNKEISHLMDEVLKYQSSIEETRREIDGAIEEKEKAIERICVLEKHLKTAEVYATEKCLKVQEEANSLKEQLESLKCYIKSVAFSEEFESIRNYLMNIKSLEGERECLITELEEKRALLDEYTCKLQESKQQLASVQSLSEEHAKQNLVLQEELENVRVLYSNSANEIESCQGKLKEQMHMLGQLEIEKSELLEKIASLKVVDDAHVQSSSSVERVQKELKDTEDKMRKMKALAVRTKKELADVKKQLSDMTEERNHLKKRNDQLIKENEKTLSDCRQYLSNFQSLQSEYDKLEDKYEAERLQTKQLQQDIAHSATELVTVKEKLEELKFENESLKKGRDNITSEKKNLEHLKTELDGKLIVADSLLQNEIKKHEEAKSELQNTSQKVKQLEDQLKSERLQHTSTTQQLEQALKEAKQQNLLNLEIDDYKRIVSETKTNLEGKVKDIKELHSELAHEKEKHCMLMEEMKHVESQWKTEESRANNLKELLSKTKDELSRLENQEILLNERLSEHQRQLESLVQKEELYKVQLSEASAENRKLCEMMQNIKDSHAKTAKSLETKIAILEEQLKMAGLEVEGTKQEFENYKIRVHSVLKQKKEQSPVPSPQDETKLQMEKLIEQSRAKLEELSQKMQASLAENSAIQEEKDQLVHHLTKLTEEMQLKEAMWTKRLNQMLIERDSYQKQQESLSEQLQQQSQMLTANFKQRLQAMQEKHSAEVNSLQKQLEAADVEISHLQREYQKSSSPSHPPDDLPHFDIFSQERQEGEGSECTDRESITPIVNSSLNTIPTSGFLPFDQLLQTPTDSLSASIISNQDVDSVSSNLATAHKKLEHVTELLNESEANNLRMTEQVRVLKEEIRRLERNKERQDHAENLEYLKNIVVKFITLEGGDERLRLIPVLTTMLRLSPEEQAQMLNIASGEASSNTPSGWGNYLHRWSGLV